MRAGKEEGGIKHRKGTRFVERDRGREGDGLYGDIRDIREGGNASECARTEVRQRGTDGEGEVENDRKEMEMEKENRDRG